MLPQMAQRRRSIGKYAPGKIDYAQYIPGRAIPPGYLL
jgi:hypothetical protein